jgi:hypothetical protein
MYDENYLLRVGREALKVFVIRRLDLYGSRSIEAMETVVREMEAPANSALLLNNVKACNGLPFPVPEESNPLSYCGLIIVAAHPKHLAILYQGIVGAIDHVIELSGAVEENAEN